MQTQCALGGMHGPGTHLTATMAKVQIARHHILFLIIQAIVNRKLFPGKYLTQREKQYMTLIWIRIAVVRARMIDIVNTLLLSADPA